ncbi:MAG: ATP-binding cassette domain-containing protein [Acidimicrobiia bacterium]
MTAATLPAATAATATAPAVIDADRITKSFGDQLALDDITLVVPEGSIVGLIGPSGCGKSTLVRVLTGIIRPTSGRVSVFGHDPASASSAHRARFGYMPQMPVLFPNLTLWANLNFMASVYGIPLRRRRRHLMQLLELVDLADHRHKRLSESSGGMQRRLALAATLVHQPELLFLDEPTAGVDPILRERFWAHFRALRDEGKTIVVPTQYVGEAVSCDVVAVMAHGRLLTVQPPDLLKRTAYEGTPLTVTLQHGWLAGTEIARLESVDFVRSVRRSEDGLVVVVDDAEADTRRLEEHFVSSGIAIGEIAPAEPSFDDIFVEIVERANQAARSEAR